MALDGGWGWAVVTGSFLCQLIADGCAFSFGILYSELLDYFQESKSTTAWIGSLFIAVPLITAPVASVFTNKFGCRIVTVLGGFIAGLGCALSALADSIWMLCLTFGLLAGFGLALVYVPAVVIITQYFDKKLGLATGVAVAGSGIGTFVFAPVTEMLIQYYGWRGTMLLIGGMMLQICVCGMLFRTAPQQPIQAYPMPHKRSTLNLFTDNSGSRQDLEKSSSSDCKTISDYKTETVNISHHDEGNNNMLISKDSDTTAKKSACDCSSNKLLHSMCSSVDFTVLCNPSFVYFCVSIFLLYISYDIPYIFTPDKAIHMGISEEKASLLVSIIGITSTFGQIFVGIVGDMPKVNTIVLYNVFTIIAGIFTLLVPWYHNYALLCMYAACYGVFISANYTLVSVILVDLLGTEAFANAYGFEMMAEGLANIIGPPFGGWLTDVTGSYNLTFILNGSIMVISGAMLFAMPCFRNKSHHHLPTITTEVGLDSC